VRRMFALLGIVVFIVCAVALPASAATIVVSPTTVSTSGTVTVSGDVSAGGALGCAVPGPVTLISNAFSGISEFAGQGAVMLPVDATGHFSSRVTLKPSVAAGTYTITGRCGGGNLGVVANLTVTGLPRTGASFGPLSSAEVLAIAAGLVGLGVVLVRTGRRRDPTSPARTT
jgi:hypothetical protein